jgi:Mg/Co/Ni transporter MgtE
MDERLGEVRGRLGGDDRDPVIVVDRDRVVLGSVNREALTGDPATLVEEVMNAGPPTFRPNVHAGEMPDYFKRRSIEHALVTTSDGVLIGLLHLESAERPQARRQSGD